MKGNNKLLIAFVLILIAMWGLRYQLGQVNTELYEMSLKFEDIKIKSDQLKNFDDSLAGNENFRKHLLDTLKYFDNINQYRKIQRFDFENELNEFKLTIADKDNLFRRKKIYESVITLLRVAFGSMLIILVIKLWGQQ